MSLHDLKVTTLSGETITLGDLTGGTAALVVNVASKCGLTPQYAGLERIAEFCSATYGVTFPLTEKIEVNGDNRHPLYAELVTVPDAEGYTGDIRWNFEKFLVAPDGTVVRFGPRTEPEDASVVTAIEAALPA